MSAIGLRLRIRRDGTLCLTDAEGRVAGADRAFPEEHSFTYEFIGRNGASAKIDGDELKLELANARATYEIVKKGDTGVDVKLVSSELFDAPPIDEDAAAAIQEAKGVVNEAAAGQAVGATEARPGQAVVNEEGTA